MRAPETSGLNTPAAGIASTEPWPDLAEPTMAPSQPEPTPAPPAVIPPPRPPVDYETEVVDAIAQNAALASSIAMDLTKAADANEIAWALREELRARNRAERLMIDQFAVAHVTAMKLMARVRSWTGRAEQDFRLGMTQQAQAWNTEAARLATVSARLVSAAAEVMLTIERMRNRGRQSITVKHLSVVSPGGVDGGARRGGEVDRNDHTTR